MIATCDHRFKDGICGKPASCAVYSHGNMVGYSCDEHVRAFESVEACCIKLYGKVYPDPKLGELRFLLRQVFYARNPLGQQFNEVLKDWGLDQYELRIIAALDPSRVTITHATPNHK